MTIYWTINNQGVDVWEDDHSGVADHHIDGPVSWLGEHPDEIKHILSDTALSDWIRGDIQKVDET